MRVLLLETEPGVAVSEAAQLAAAGHEVAQCRDEAGDSFACKGLMEGHQCPLEERVVDVAVVAGDVQPGSVAYDGVRCALRRHVPLVITSGTDTPYADFAAAIAAPGDLAAAVETAAAAPLSRHGAAASRSMRSVLEAHGYDPEGADVEVIRRGADLRVTVDTREPVPRAVADILSVRIVGAVRDVDPYARIIDVSVVSVEDEASSTPVAQPLTTDT
ncbi:MAG: hypothetical protein N2037_12215 [Acidimicrobiales bacterium]|nr:hypothetical protein [Acidimicrobiales bacterium]